VDSAGAIRAAVSAGPVLMPGVYDALSARLARDAGFEVLFVSGFAVAASRMAAPDLGYVALSDMADAGRAVTRIGGGPVIVDADTGYGNALSARHTADTLARSGAAGIFLEDQVWPKRCGHFAGKRVVARDEWLGKLKAVIDWRDETGLDLYLVARTDARAAVGLDEAIARAQAARDLGVDAAFVEAPQSEDELRRVHTEVDGVTLVANMIEGGRTPLYTPSELDGLGYRLIVSPLTGLMAAARAIETAMERLKEDGVLREAGELLMGFEEFEKVTRMEDHRARGERYASD
jgi:2-methylisocitrate lyase-like PEP mutase family enzyme